jgi:triosephosphate isomerase (TIM)
MVLFVNLKSYDTSRTRILSICEAAALLDTPKTPIYVAVPSFFLSEASQRCRTLAQHVDDVEADRNTGFAPVGLAKRAGASGSIINHSEHRLPTATIASLITRLRAQKLISIVCARDDRQAKVLAAFAPDYIAVEPPALIGGEVSVSTADPALIERSVNAVRRVDPNVKVLVGAGIRSADDIRIARELGAHGVLLASEVAKSARPKETMRRLLRGF